MVLPYSLRMALYDRSATVFAASHLHFVNFNFLHAGDGRKPSNSSRRWVCGKPQLEDKNNERGEVEARIQPIKLNRSF